MTRSMPNRPQRGFVQTPAIIAVRLSFFAVLLILAVWAVVAGSGFWRWLGAGFLLLSAFALAFSLYVMWRPTQLPSPKPEADRNVGAEPETRFAVAPEQVGEIRVYPLQTGETLVSFGQLFKGNDGWVGMRAVWNMGADEATVFWTPVHAYLIVHPQQGPILFDTGLSRAQTQKGYYSARKGGLAGMIWKVDDNYLPPEQELAAQLESLGVAPEEVRHVVMSHLHEDHVGELNRFAGARVHISQAEWDDRRRMGYGPSWAQIGQPNTFTFGSGRFHAFGASEDLFGDGSVILVPTYGHSLGHTSLFTHAGETPVCLAADALYTLRHLHPDSLNSFNYFGPQGLATQADSARRISDTQRAIPDLVIIPTHDPFVYTRELVHPSLADGRLSEEERRELLAYQGRLYDEEGRLREEARPRWERERDGYGRVWAEIS